MLESVAFSTMTQARGPPYRTIDMFDELVAKIVPSDRNKTVDELLNELIPIVDHLCQNVINFFCALMASFIFLYFTFQV